jgi:putative heme-binding domain-containing protein
MWLALVVMACAVRSSGAQPKEGPPQWIWYPEGDPRAEAPAGARYFRRVFNLEAPADSAKIDATADNHFKVWVNGRLVGRGDAWQELNTFDVAKDLKAGANLIAVEATNDSGPAGLVVRLEGKAKGTTFRVVSDATWSASQEPAKGWQSNAELAAKWPAALVLGEYGKTAPWNVGGKPVAARGPKERFTIPDGFVLEKVVPADATWEGMPAGRHVSFVNCCFDAKGRLLLSQEGGPIVICAKKDDKTGFYTTLPIYCDKVTNCHGMAWVHDSLYLVGNGPQGTGLYRCRDTKGTGRIDDVKLLHHYRGGMGEHGPHAVLHGPDDMLYLVVGNHANVQIGIEGPNNNVNPLKIAANSPLLRWPTGLNGPDQDKANSTEDVLLPRLNDANGHAANILAPGGTIWRCDLDGKKMALVSAGYRNQFDAAFNPHGELFTFDSDMEWDIGLPWYRPVRILHAPMGSDFGWRTGAANQQGYLFDTLPALHDTGRGSPVGVECYDGFSWPAKYRGAALCADWSLGIIYAVLPEISGGTYKAKIEKFITGQPMNVTDLAVGPDDALYFSLGGRNGQGEVYRLRAKDYKGPNFAVGIDGGAQLKLLFANQPLAPFRRAEIRELIRAGGPTIVSFLSETARKKELDPNARLRALDYLNVYTPEGVPTGHLIEMLNDKNVVLRAHAIYLLGLRNPPEANAALRQALKDPHPFVQRRACEALIRAGIEPSLEELWPVLGHPDRFLRFAARSVLERIDPKKWAKRLEDPEKLGLYHGLDMIVALCRADKAEPYADAIFDFLETFDRPSIDNDMLDVVRAMQLALCHTKERPGSIRPVGKAWAAAFPHPDHRVSREMAIVLADLGKEKLIEPGFQGRLLQEMQNKKVDREQQIHYFYCLRVLKEGWTDTDKKVLLMWFDGAKTWSGGNSFVGFLQNIFRDIVPAFTPADRNQILADAAERPWPALVMLQSPTAKDLPPTKLSDAYTALQSASGQMKVRELRDQIVLLLGQNATAEGQAAVRAIGDTDPDAAEAVARTLVKRPSQENWPYLVRGLGSNSQVVLPELVRVLRKMPEKPKVSMPPTADEAKPYRALIQASSRLKENERWQAALLLRHWGGKSFALDDGDWKTEITGWARWYGQTFPTAPSLPNVAALTSSSKWKMNELLTYLDKSKDGDVVRGRKIFEKANCIKCHKFGNVGEGIGPDLTTVKARFKKIDVLESILDPSKVISDQYRGTTFVTKSGQTISGLAALQGDTYTVLQSDGTKVTLPRGQIEQQVASTVSPMPERLIDELTREEIADLFAFLESDPATAR